MSVIVTDEGFAPDTWERGFTALADLPANDTMDAALPSHAACG